MVVYIYSSVGNYDLIGEDRANNRREYLVYADRFCSVGGVLTLNEDPWTYTVRRETNAKITKLNDKVLLLL